LSGALAESNENDWEKNFAAHRIRLENLLHANGKVLEEVARDGNCFFHALTKQLMDTNPAFSHLDLRNTICDHMLEHSDQYIEFSEHRSVEEFNTQVRHLRSNGVWDESIADVLPAAVSNYFQTDINIYSSGPMPLTVFQPSFLTNQRSKKVDAFYLAHYQIKNCEHYDAVRDTCSDKIHVFPYLTSNENTTQKPVNESMHTVCDPTPLMPLPLTCEQEPVTLADGNEWTIETYSDFPLIMNPFEPEPDLHDDSTSPEIPLIMTNNEDAIHLSSNLSTPTVYPSPNILVHNSTDITNEGEKCVENIGGNTAIQNTPSDSVPECEVVIENLDSYNRSLSGPAKWKKNVRKLKRQLGKPYTSSNGVERKGRSMKPVPNEPCSLECSANISETTRFDIFTQFWCLGSKDRQRDFVNSHVTQQPIQTRRIANNAIKQRSLTYSLTVLDKRVRVCKSFF
jgi:hypothetical protein